MNSTYNTPSYTVRRGTWSLGVYQGEPSERFSESPAYLAARRTEDAAMSVEGLTVGDRVVLADDLLALEVGERIAFGEVSVERTA